MAQSLWEQAKKHYDNYNYSLVTPLLDKIDKLSSKSTIDPMILMRATNTRGAISSYNNDYVNAEIHFLKSLEYAKQIDNPVFICSRYDNLANAYTQIKDFKKAIDYLELSRQLKEKSHNEKDLPITLLQLSSLQFEIGDIDSSEKTSKEALTFIRKYNYKGILHHYYFHLGKINEGQKKYKKTIAAYNQCIKYAIEINDHSTIAKAYSNQAHIYLQLKEWKKAYTKYAMSIKIARDHKLREIDLLASTHMGLICLNRGDIKQGRQLYEYVSANIQPTDIDLLLTDLEELKSLLYEAEGEYKTSLDAYKNYLTYYKKQYDNDRAQSIQNIQAKYEAEKKDRALEKAKLLHAQSELKALRAQMDPHFIFNALNSMRKELLEGNIEGADAYLVRFSKLLRMILDTTRTPEIRLSDNIELLHLYIQIEKTRQGNRFDYKIVSKGIDPDSTFIPGLILQPLAENAIVHGLYNKKNGQGKLLITFSKTKEALVIKVKDNGVGRLASKDKVKSGHISHAMSIIRETLDLTWQGRNVKNYFTIKDLMTKDNSNIGTEVTVLLPLS